MGGGDGRGGGVELFSKGWTDPQGHHVNNAGTFLCLEEEQLQKA